MVEDHPSSLILPITHPAPLSKEDDLSLIPFFLTSIILPHPCQKTFQVLSIASGDRVKLEVMRGPAGCSGCVWTSSGRYASAPEREMPQTVGWTSCVGTNIHHPWDTSAQPGSKWRHAMHGKYTLQVLHRYYKIEHRWRRSLQCQHMTW